VKRQQQEIEKLKEEKENLIKEVKTLKQDMRNIQQEHEKETSKLKQEIKKIYDLFPHIRELLRIENLCKVLNFGEELIKLILQCKPVGFKGELYSPKYKRGFKNGIFQSQSERRTKASRKVPVAN
jgi:FtsZ-binding cell division protein ZapB